MVEDNNRGVVTEINVAQCIIISENIFIPTYDLLNCLIDYK